MATERVIILSGIPGSGKSRYANHLAIEAGPLYAEIVSADYYFLEQYTGRYAFNPRKLGEAHACCFRRFLAALQTGASLIVVDNTNTRYDEISPYILGAAAWGVEATALTFMVGGPDGVNRCAARNVHGVPLAACMAMHDRLSKRVLPPLVKHERRLVTF